MKLLLIGPLPPPFSGTTVSFQSLRDDLALCAGTKIENVISTEANKDSFIFVKFFISLKSLFKIYKLYQNVDFIIINGSNSRLIFLALACYPIKKKIIIRFFGGSLHNKYRNANFVLRFIIKVIFNAFPVFLQTHEMINFFQKEFTDASLFHLPTSRSRLPYLDKLRASTGPIVHIVMLSEIRTEKGIENLREAEKSLSKQLGSIYKITTYGHTLDPYNFLKKGDVFPEAFNLIYGGILRPDEVPGVLMGADIFVLPTFFEGEGYPGSIIEALHASLPIVTTHWQSIPELVDESCSILVEPRKSDDLAAALAELIKNKDLRYKLSCGSREKSKNFDSAFWNGLGFIELIKKAKNYE